jgi:glycosyltransferase involved in cell wall biosynthesis
MKEIIVNNKNGLLFKKNNSEDLRKKITYLKENENISKKISKNAKLSYRRLYTSDIMVKNYKKYF